VHPAPGVRLDLTPIPAFTGPIGRFAALAHYPFKSVFLGRSARRPGQSPKTSTARRRWRIAEVGRIDAW